MIRPFQTGLMPAGQFDFLDAQISDIKGGEVVVFQTEPNDIDDVATPDVYNETERSLLRKATASDSGPFFFVDSDRNAGAVSEIGFEARSGFSTASPVVRPTNASGKLSIWSEEGFYSITTDVVDIATVNELTNPNTRLYVNDQGFLTTTPGSTAALIAYFVEWRDKDAVAAAPAPFQVAGSTEKSDTVIVYKANADGYLNLALSQIQDAIGSQASIGTPTDGTYNDGYVQTLTPDTSIADGIDALNEGLQEVFTSSGTAGAIGTPTDGTYLDGFFPFTPSTTTANAVDDINELLLAIAPAKPGDLTGQALAVSGTTQFSAILPSGLTAAWYSGGDSPGGTIASYIVDNTYLLDSPDQANRFNGGFTSDTSQLGVVTHVLNGADGYARDVATLGVGTTGTVTVDDISIFNTIWNKINAEISVTQTAEGRETHAMKHTLAGTSNTSEFFYDDVATAPSFSVSPTITENTAVDGYLSGIIHYASGSTFDVSYTATSGIFEKAYHPTEVSRIELPGSPNTSVNPGSVPAVSDTFAVSNQTITLSVANVARETPIMTARLFKPDGQTTSDTDSLGRALNTFGTASTATTESFVDEAQRLVGIGSSSPDWTSSDPLVDGYAQVKIVGSGGQVQFADATDYPGFVAAEQVYQRHFTKAAASSGSIVFGGFTVAQIDSYGTGDTNVLLRLDTDGLYFDAGRPFGSNNGTGSGDSPANSIGCQVGTSSGSTLDFTFGVNSTATNGNRYRVQLIFRNTNDSITSLTTS